MTPLISVIIPVYNARLYLRNSIESVLSQRFTDFELLLIDDGSTDGSGKICDEYATKDNRIKVFHKANGGVSSARNMGLDNASGEWIAFVDSDDELLHSWSNVSALIRKDIDFISFGYERHSIEKNIFTTIPQEEKIVDINQSVTLMYMDKFYQFYAVTKLFKRSIIINNNLRFDETLYFSEDRLFIINYLCVMSGKMYYTAMPMYKYIIRQTGAMMSLVGRFNYKSVTGFDAAVKMYYCLNNSQIVTEENKKLASMDVIRSYNITRNAMNRYHVRDKQLVSKLNRGLRNVLPVRQYAIVRLKQYIKELINERLNNQRKQ